MSFGWQGEQLLHTFTVLATPLTAELKNTKNLIMLILYCMSKLNPFIKVKFKALSDIFIFPVVLKLVAVLPYIQYDNYCIPAIVWGL